MKLRKTWGVLSALLATGLTFNPELLAMLERWEGVHFSRWWGLAPVIVLLLDAWWKTVCDKVVEIENAKQTAETAREEEEATKNQALSQLSELRAQLAAKPIDPQLTLTYEEPPRDSSLLIRNGSTSQSAFNVVMKVIVGSAYKLASDQIPKIGPQGDVKRLRLYSVPLKGKPTPVQKKYRRPDPFLGEKVGASGRVQIPVELTYSDASGTAYVNESDVEWSISMGRFIVSSVVLKKISRIEESSSRIQ